MKKMEVLGLQAVPEIEQGDDLARIVVDCASEEADGVQDKDIIVLTSKIVSKALGLTRNLNDVKPGRKALSISRRTGKDPKWVQMIFDEGQKILAAIPLKGAISRRIMSASEDTDRSWSLCRTEQAVFITLSKNGRVHTCDAGIDGSNHPAGIVSLMPEEPDAVAKDLREAIENLTGKTVAVILADTEIVPFGTMDFAVGSSGIEPCSKMFGRVDNFGKPKFGGIDLVAHELTAASALVFGQVNAGIPVAIIRGYDYEPSETENVSNTLLPQSSKADVRKAIKRIIKATAGTRNLKDRLLLKAVMWFV